MPNLREAYLLLFGEIGGRRMGTARGRRSRCSGAFTESQHLVDFVNQVDFVEHPAGEAKLGQPMVHFTWSSDWGVMEILGLPYHRARTFPGRAGRLRLPLVVEDEHVEYESAAKEAACGLRRSLQSQFWTARYGCERIQRHQPGACAEVTLGSQRRTGLGSVLRADSRQFGLDAQLTVGSWLFKLEAIQRTGARNLSGREEDYVASVFGGEYTFYSVFGSSCRSQLCSANGITMAGAAMRLQAARPIRSKTIFSAPCALRSTTFRAAKLVASMLGDVDRATRALAVALERRLAERWSGERRGDLSPQHRRSGYPLRDPTRQLR